MDTARSFFRPDQTAAVKEAIIASEMLTSGEIRVFIEKKCGENTIGRASEVFKELKLHETAQRNGVLYYLAVEDRKFAILGDEGINKKVPEDFWETIKEQMQLRFRAGEFTEGMVEGIQLAGEKLKEHFPYQRDDVNELPDEIIFG